MCGLHFTDFPQNCSINHEDGQTDWLIGLCSVLRPRQHSIGYMGDGFYSQKTQPTVSKYWRRCYKGQSKQRKQRNTYRYGQTIIYTKRIDGQMDWHTAADVEMAAQLRSETKWKLELKRLKSVMNINNSDALWYLESIVPVATNAFMNVTQFLLLMDTYYTVSVLIITKQ